MHSKAIETRSIQELVEHVEHEGGGIADLKARLKAVGADPSEIREAVDHWTRIKPSDLLKSPTSPPKRPVERSGGIAATPAPDGGSPTQEAAPARPGAVVAPALFGGHVAVKVENGETRIELSTPAAVGLGLAAMTTGALIAKIA